MFEYTFHNNSSFHLELELNCKRPSGSQRINFGVPSFGVTDFRREGMRLEGGEGFVSAETQTDTRHLIGTYAHIGKRVTEGDILDTEIIAALNEIAGVLAVTDVPAFHQTCSRRVGVGRTLSVPAAGV